MFKMLGRFGSSRQASMLLCYVCFLPTTVVVVHGWGQKGHEIVGNLASSLLSKAALRRISLLLNVTQPLPEDSLITMITARDVNDRHRSTRYVGFSNCSEHCSPLAMVADWADQVRYRYHWSAPLHYIDIRDDIIPFGCPVAFLSASIAHSHCSFNYTRDCPDDSCVAGAIMNYTEHLYNRFDGTTFEQRIIEQGQQLKESLMFLVHFVGDIHQPLHCSRTTDRGGNNIHVHYDVSLDPTVQIASRRDLNRTHKFHLRHHRSLNLHAVWDDSIIETMIESDFDCSRNTMEASLLSYIWTTRATNPSLYSNVWLGCAEATSKICVSQWAEQSFQYALQYAYANVDGKEVIDGSILDDQYYETRSPIVRECLAVAAVRLANNLERIFGDEMNLQLYE